MSLWCLRLDWTNLSSFPPDLTADLLLGSDLVYDRKILTILVPAVDRLLSSGNDSDLDYTLFHSFNPNPNPSHLPSLDHALLVPPDGCLLYVAPDSGRDGMADLIDALSSVGIHCVSRLSAPER